LIEVLSQRHFHQARNDFRDGAPVKPWLYTIAVNVRRELFRKRRRKPETPYDMDRHPEPTVEPDVSIAMVKVRALRAYKRLRGILDETN